MSARKASAAVVAVAEVASVETARAASVAVTAEKAVNAEKAVSTEKAVRDAEEVVSEVAVAAVLLKVVLFAYSRAIYGRRLANVEPVFANIRAQKRMDRFTLRGRQKVNVQWTLFCLVHNIEKIQNYGERYAKAS